MDIQKNNENVARCLLREVILHHKGDYKSLIKITDELDSILGVHFIESLFTKMVCEWFGKEIQAINENPYKERERRTICFSFIVWGEKYIENILRCCFASFLADGNIPSLVKERDVVFLIHTDKSSELLLIQSPIVKKLQGYGVKFEFRFLPSDVTLYVPQNINNKYWLLGAAESIHILIAKQMNADFHCATPDTIYSENFFLNMMRGVNAGKKNILQSMIGRVDMENCLSDLNRYIKDGVISVEASKLCAIAMNHINIVTHRLVINNSPDIRLWPKFHQLIWEGKELHVICQHVHPAYLDMDIVSKIKERYYMTLDSEMDKIIPEEEPIHFIESTDDMAVIEVGLPVFVNPEPYVNINEYCSYFWNRTGTRKLGRYFMQETTYPMDHTTRIGSSLLSDAEIKDSKNIVQKSVEATCPYED